MKQRYYVSYKHLDEGSTQTTTTMFGRFLDQDDAERCARAKYGVSDNEITSVRTETAFEAARYKTYRFFIRLTRITCAIVIGFFSYAWLYDKGVDTGDIPLASLTGNMIFSNIIHMGLSVSAAWLCWVIAFGEGPDN